MGAFFLRRPGDLGGGQAYALVDDLETRVAALDGDLLGAIAVPVQAGLADQQAQRPAQFLAGDPHPASHLIHCRGIHLSRHGDVDAGGRAVFAEHLPQYLAPLPGGDAGPGALDGGRHDIVAIDRRLAQRRQGGLDCGLVAAGPKGLQGGDLVALRLYVHLHDAGIRARGEWRFSGLVVAVHTDDLEVAALDVAHAPGVALHQLALDVAALYGLYHAALLGDAGHLRLGTGNQLLYLRLHHGGAVQQVAVFQQVGLQRQHLLHAQGPLLVPGAGQAQRLVPGGQLYRPGPGVL